MKRGRWTLLCVAWVVSSTYAHDASADSPVPARQIIRRAKLQVGAKIEGASAKLLGQLERVGLKYKVEAYERQVSPGLWRGSRLPKEGYADLAKRGFKTIIGLTLEGDLDAGPAEAVGLRHERISILDNSVPNRGQLDTFLSIVRDPRNLPAYVHCEAGVGRTGVMVAVYRMAVEGWPLGKTLSEARRYGLSLREQVEFLRKFARDFRAGSYSEDNVRERLAMPTVEVNPRLALERAAARAKDAAHWAGQAIKPIPEALAAGMKKRMEGATALSELAEAELGKMSPVELAERASTLLYANRVDRTVNGGLLKRTFARVLSAYDGDAELGAAKTEQLLSHMLLSEQNASRVGRRLGDDAVASVVAKLAALRLDSSRPVEERIRELKRRVVVNNGPSKRGRMTFFRTGEEIEAALMAEIDKAKAAAQAGKPAHFLFSTYALEDDAHPVGARFAAALKSAADAGVQIVGLYDGFGSKHSGVDKAVTDRAYYAKMNAYASPDGEQRISLVPIKASPLISHGSHQKWTLAVLGDEDDQAQLSSLVLDANLGSHYIGKDAPWQDTAAHIEGPPTEDIAEMVRDRLVANGYRPSASLLHRLATPQRPVADSEAAEISVLNHVAGRDLKNKNFVLNTISSLGKGDELDWSEPYGDDGDITNALVAAAGRGANVHLVYNRNNDLVTTAAAERATYEQLLDAGIVVHEYGRTLASQPSRKDQPRQVSAPDTKVFSHAKVMLVRYANGQKILAIGSSNADARSEGDSIVAGVLTGNDETLTIVYGGKQVDEVDEKFMKPQLSIYSSPVSYADVAHGLGTRLQKVGLKMIRGLN
jgi:phosphatidylserine/phosphatidylglycerophosphate/cardiolipin synthase-like enzyme/protein-tyrosine phosphatase